MNPSHPNGSGQRCLPVNGRVFEDTIDGYFALQESLLQLLVRQQFTSAWISIVEAPFIVLPDIPPTSPVPMKLHPHTPSGIIQYMAVVAAVRNDKIQLSGVARWSGLTQDSAFQQKLPQSLRLAEPAFVRGIGLMAGEFETRNYGHISTAKSPGDIALLELRNQSPKQALHRLGWETGLFWGLQHNENTILRFNESNICIAEPRPLKPEYNDAEPAFEYLALNTGLQYPLATLKHLASEH